MSVRTRRRVSGSRILRGFTSRYLAKSSCSSCESVAWRRAGVDARRAYPGSSVTPSSGMPSKEAMAGSAASAEMHVATECRRDADGTTLRWRPPTTRAAADRGGAGHPPRAVPARDAEGPPPGELGQKSAGMDAADALAASYMPPAVGRDPATIDPAVCPTEMRIVSYGLNLRSWGSSRAVTNAGCTRNAARYLGCREQALVVSHRLRVLGMAPPRGLMPESFAVRSDSYMARMGVAGVGPGSKKSAGRPVTFGVMAWCVVHGARAAVLKGCGGSSWPCVRDRRRGLQ